MCLYKYSVIIPLFNKKDTILRAINSIINQKHDVEIIIVDDGSTDGSIEQLNNISYDNIKIIKQENRGVSAARNRGIYASSNDLIGFLDADDEWLPNFLRTIDSLIDTYPSANAFATSFQYKSGNMEIKKNIPSLPIDYRGIPNFFKCVNKQDLFHTSSIVINKNVFSNIGGFNEQMRFGQDGDMWVRIALNYNIAFDASIGSNYYIDVPNQSIKQRSPTIIHFSDSVKNYYKNNKINNRYLINYTNKSLCLVALKNIAYGFPNEGRLLLKKRIGSNKLLLAGSCYLLSYFPSIISLYIYNIWVKISHGIN